MTSLKARLLFRCCLKDTRSVLGIVQPHPWSCTRSFVSRSYATISGTTAEEDQTPSPLKNPFPYPSTSAPTPHQIFHLSTGATQAQIKTRYYELVKVHHPDSQYAGDLSPDVAHARFRAIQAAYDFLRGKTISPHPNARPGSGAASFDPYMHELAKRRRAYYAHHSSYRRSYEAETGSEGWAKPGWGEGFGAPANQRTVWHKDGWRERMILAFGVMTLLAGLFPSLPFTVASMFITPSASSSSYVAPTSAPQRHNSASDTDAPISASDAANSFSVPFIDLDKNHREAVSALQQVRHERKEIGPERREGMRRRVREMAMADPLQLQDQACHSASGEQTQSDDGVSAGSTVADGVDEGR